MVSSSPVGSVWFRGEVRAGAQAVMPAPDTGRLSRDLLGPVMGRQLCRSLRKDVGWKDVSLTPGNLQFFSFIEMLGWENP